MSEINNIKKRYARGESYAEISRQTGKDVKTIKKYLCQEDYSPEAPTHEIKPSILDPYKAQIICWLNEDMGRWYKQRHTAQRIYDRLRTELGYEGSYPTVQRFVKDWKELHRAVQSYQELVWHPGEAQVDMGEADFIYCGHRRRLLYLTISFPYSNHSFTQIIQDVTALSICQALKDIFTYVGLVPKVLIFDNATGVGKRFGGKEVETELFGRFRAHYVFALRFCNPHAGHEKGNVESKIGDTRRNLFVPERSFVDLQQFNHRLLDECNERGRRNHYKKGDLICRLFAEDKAAMHALPRHDFDVCEYRRIPTDKYGHVQIGSKHFYGSRPELASQELLIRIRTNEVTVFDKKQVELASYPRVFGSKYTVYSTPEASLKHLSRHPGAWFNSQLRESMDEEFKQILDDLDGYNRREVLKTFSALSEDYNYSLAVEAVKEGLYRNYVDFDTIAVIAARLKDGGLNMQPREGPNLAEYDKILKEAR